MFPPPNNIFFFDSKEGKQIFFKDGLIFIMIKNVFIFGILWNPNFLDLFRWYIFYTLLGNYKKSEQLLDLLSYLWITIPVCLSASQWTGNWYPRKKCLHFLWWYLTFFPLNDIQDYLERKCISRNRLRGNRKQAPNFCQVCFTTLKKNSKEIIPINEVVQYVSILCITF